jgi:hypothetical protein
LRPGSDVVVRFAERLREATDGAIALVYVVPEITEGSLVDSLLRPDAVLSPEIAHSRLQAFRESLSRDGEAQVLSGSSGKQIDLLSAGFDRAVVVMGRRAGLGATAAHLIRRRRFPVVVVPV